MPKTCDCERDPLTFFIQERNPGQRFDIYGTITKQSECEKEGVQNFALPGYREPAALYHREAHCKNYPAASILVSSFFCPVIFLIVVLIFSAKWQIQHAFFIIYRLRKFYGDLQIELKKFKHTGLLIPGESTIDLKCHVID
jgi:hypothetical protein